MRQVKFLVWLVVLLISNKEISAQYNWSQIIGSPYNGGKQDDIYFINPDTGWSVNGSGKIFRTNNGAASWTTQLTQTGTYFRCIQMVDEQIGFAGNIGTNYFPNVTDTVPLYKTIDGGVSWSPVTNIVGPTVKGLCAFDMIKTPFINAGVLDTNITIYGAGRVGSPTFLLKSDDGGQNWTSKNMSAYCSMILDVKFVTKDTGFVFAGTNPNVNSCKAKILYTTDGGQTFTTVYTSTRLLELCWKASFPSRNVGYATLLSYDSSTGQRYIVKTTDGGLSWTELPLTTAGGEEFGIGFLNDSVGWVGTSSTGYQTIDGGLTWTTKSLGQYANKIRIVKTPQITTGYAIGLRVYKLSISSPTSIEEVQTSGIVIYPNPSDSQLITVKSKKIDWENAKVEIANSIGQKLKLEHNTIENGIVFNSNQFARGEYILYVTDKEKAYVERFLVGEIKP